MKELKNNFIFGAGLAFVFIMIEFLFRVNHDSLVDILKPQDYLALFLLFFLGSFLTQRVFIVLISFFVGLFIIQIAHYNYFGYFLFPMEFLLFFTKSNEVFQTLNTKLEILIEPFIYMLIMIATIWYLLKKSKDRKKSKIFTYIFIIIMIAPIINTGIHYKKRALGERPNSNKSLVKNSLYVTKCFLGKTLPLEILDLHVVEDYQVKSEFKKSLDKKVDNLILVIGESLSLRYMSLYGYDKDTTPYLKKLVDSGKVYATKAISGGVFTDTSIPMILNIAQKPNAIKHILSNKTNLFKMAKENGYKTYWISAQANDYFSYIRSYMGLKYIDKYIDSSNFGCDNYTPTLDSILLSELKKIDLKDGGNFIVLNMMGSHEPYEDRTPEEFKPFGRDTVANYENSIAYTDKLLFEMIEYIKSVKERKTLLLFTSDHGQHVGKNGYGKGDIRDKKDFEVPFLLFAKNIKLDKNIVDLFHREFIPHYDMDLICGHYLGYDTLGSLEYKKAYVIGGELSGNAGYLEYDIDDGKMTFK